MLTKWTKPEDIAGLYAGDRILMVCEERSRFGKMENHVVILEATEDGWTSPDETYIGYTPGDGTDWISEKDFRELLAIREAGDEEVEKHFANLRLVFGNTDSMAQSLAADSIYALRKIVAERKELCQQLREAQAEIERLKGCLKKSNDGFEEHERLWYLEQNKTEDLTAELAALKSAPGMEDIDALEKQLDEHYKPKFGMVRRPSEITRDSFDLARRSIAAREEEKKRADEAEHAMLEAVDATNEDYREVVGLMKWVWKIIVCNELILSYIRRCDKPEAKAILEIVEGE